MSISSVKRNASDCITNEVVIGYHTTIGHHDAAIGFIALEVDDPCVGKVDLDCLESLFVHHGIDYSRVVGQVNTLSDKISRVFV